MMKLTATARDRGCRASHPRSSWRWLRCQRHPLLFFRQRRRYWQFAPETRAKVRHGSMVLMDVQEVEW